MRDLGSENYNSTREKEGNGVESGDEEGQGEGGAPGGDVGGTGGLRLVTQVVGTVTVGLRLQQRNTSTC